MTESVAIAIGGERATAPPVAVALTRRASLNALAALLDYAGQLLAGLLLTPVLVRGLGPALFGSWEMLVRFGGYVSATDGRPTEALRLVVARSHSEPDARKRRLVGAAISVWMLLLPLVGILGAILVTWAPGLVGATPENASAVRLAATFLVGSMMIGSLASVPESVLRGMNLGHTRMGAQAALHLLGAGLASAAIWTGLGIAGVGGATLLRGVATGLCFWLIVRRRVPWFGAARAPRAEVRTLLRMSLWLTAGELLARIVLASDVIILGTLVSPAAVATYVLTGYAARVAIGVHVFTAGEAMPGIGALLGQAEYARARRARRELVTLTWLYATVAGATVLLWNRHFLERWVGAEHYAGPLVNLLIVATAMQTAFIRLDAGMIDAALRPRQRVLVASLAAVVTVTLAVILTRAWGMAGLCAGVLLGRSVQSVAYPVLVRRALGAPFEPEGRDARRAARRALAGAAITTLVILSASLLLGARLSPSGWRGMVTGVLVSIPVTALVAITFGVPAAARRALGERIRGLLTSRRRP